MRFLEFAAHFLVGGLHYLVASAVLSIGLHWLMREYVRACFWSVAGSVSLVLVLLRILDAPLEPVAFYIIFFIFVPVFVAIALVTGIPFVLVRRSHRGPSETKTSFASESGPGGG